MFASSPARTTGKFLVLIAAAGALLFAITQAPLWLALLLVPLAAVPSVAAAMIGHEAAHGSFSARKSHNEIMLHLAFPLFTGLGVLHWKRKHNVLHHGHPNVVGQDDDIDLWPMALSAPVHRDSGPLRRWFQRHLQGYFFWPLTLLLSFVMRVETVKATVAAARERGIDRAWILDVGCQVVHYCLWLVLPSLYFGFWPVLAVYVGVWAVAGTLLAMIFAPAHIGLPLVSSYQRGWLHQLETTRNLRMPALLGWFFIGLQYQVEHHLFPRISHRHLPRASAIVRAWCLEHGVVYHEIEYGRGLLDVTRFMFHGWNIEPVNRGEEAATRQPAALPPLTSAVARREREPVLSSAAM